MAGIGRGEGDMGVKGERGHVGSDGAWDGGGRGSVQVEREGRRAPRWMEKLPGNRTRNGRAGSGGGGVGRAGRFSGRCG